MKIAIDCRYLGMSGIGKYLSGILENLDFEKNDYTLVGRKEKLTEIKQNFSPAYCEDSPFSLKGLFRFPSKRVNECDVFLTPNFLIPYGIKCKIFSTIHDVVFLDIKECNNGYFDYRIKKHLLKRALACSEKVFTVSNFSQERIIHYFPKHSNKIIISGCSVTKDIIEYENPNGQIDKEEILLYVGNIKKHKGLRILLDAYERIKKENRHYRLQIIGNAHNFITPDKEIADKLKDCEIEFKGCVGQTELLKCISEAKFLIQPSLYEGFGLPPLEALFLGTKPILADIPVFREVYGDFDVVFFVKNDAGALKDAIINSDFHVRTTKEEILRQYNFKTISEKIVEAIE